MYNQWRRFGGGGARGRPRVTHEGAQNTELMERGAKWRKRNKIKGR